MSQDWQFPGRERTETTAPDEQAAPNETHAEPQTRRARAERAQRSRRSTGTRPSRPEGPSDRTRRVRSGIAVVVALLLVVGAGFLVAQQVLPWLSGGADEVVTDYPGPGHGEVTVVVNPGDTGTAIASTLAEAGVVATSGAFVSAASAHPQSSGIQPGTYAMLYEMRANDALARLLDPANRVEMRVTVAEGLRVEQVVERLASVTGVPVEDVRAATADPAALGVPAEANGILEGWLYPATYSFEPGTSPVDMLATMVAQTITVLDQQGIPEGERQDVLIKASLVEREARLDEDRPKMARAIENRLERPMLLQIDATVAYGLDKSGMDLTRTDLNTPGPYNTYTEMGLPPGPIANPGLASIRAILEPAEGPWLFWVTVNLDTGETLFAETNAEHEANRQLLREWQEANQ